MLNAGADADFAGDYGRTALHVARCRAKKRASSSRHILLVKTMVWMPARSTA